MPSIKNDDTTGFESIGKRIDRLITQDVSSTDSMPPQSDKKEETSESSGSQYTGASYPRRSLGKKLLIASGVIVIILYIALASREKSREPPPAIREPTRTTTGFPSPEISSPPDIEHKLSELKMIITSNKTRLSERSSPSS